MLKGSLMTGRKWCGEQMKEKKLQTAERERDDEDTTGLQRKLHADWSFNYRHLMTDELLPNAGLKPESKWPRLTDGAVTHATNKRQSMKGTWDQTVDDIWLCTSLNHYIEMWNSSSSFTLMHLDLNNIIQWSTVTSVSIVTNSPTWSWISSATPGTLYSSPRDWFIRSSITRRWVSTWGQRSKVLQDPANSWFAHLHRLQYKKLSKLACYGLHRQHVTDLKCSTSVSQLIIHSNRVTNSLMVYNTIVCNSVVKTVLNSIKLLN